MRKTTYIVVLFLLVCGVTYGQTSYGEMIITTKLKEKFYDKDGNLLTGKGVVVADMDSGIDVFHPYFFFADGGEFDWIDVDGNKKFTPWVDAVDLNKNGQADANEKLGVLFIADGTYGLLGAESPNYQADMDFLYIDANNDKNRNYGLKDGFTEQDPTYGEQLLITIDADKNNTLSIGEKIVALKTSKVRSVREKNGTVRRRGIDLIHTEPDTIQHGTGVMGLINGGHYGVQRIHGIAPDAEVVMANIDYKYTPPYVTEFPEYLEFIKGENPNILLIEDGEWQWQFMDGSSEEELMMDEMARNGIIVIGGGGNLAGAKELMKDTLSAGETETYEISAARKSEGKINNGMFTSFLWTEPSNNISFVIETPEKQKTKVISDGSGFFTLGKYNIFYSRDVSPRNTVMMRFGFSEVDSGSVGGDWKITAMSPQNVVLWGFTGDVSQSWSGTTHWDNHVTDEGTVTFPCTGDSVIAVGAYTVNYPFYQQDVIGDLCYYSGRGYNITGKMGEDITAPGHATFSTAPDFATQIFSGTSSAAPHVVGAAVLMLQYSPTLTHSQIRQILLSTATSDNYTGTVPNSDWGYGKLNIEAAIRKTMGK
jgi:subtilisin family serine protease